jgi:hypothetical protein
MKCCTEATMALVGNNSCCPLKIEEKEKKKSKPESAGPHGAKKESWKSF